jgi:hypothetical protein
MGGIPQTVTFGTDAQSDNTSYALSLAQPIYTFGRLESAHDIAGYNLAMVREDLRAARQDLVYNVKTAYFGVLSAKELLHLGKESVEVIAQRHGCDVLNRDSTRPVNAAILDREVPVYAINGPATVIAGPSVSILLKKGVYSVGVGCRKGVRKEEVLDAIEQALAACKISTKNVFVFATTVKKMREPGLIAAIASLSAGLIFLEDETINAQPLRSPSRAGRIGLSGVAEPCALAVSKHKELVMEKTVYGRVTVAIAR